MWSLYVKLTWRRVIIKSIHNIFRDAHLGTSPGGKLPPRNDKNGFLGLGPRTARPEDKLVTLPRGQVPFVLGADFKRRRNRRTNTG